MKTGAQREVDLCDYMGFCRTVWYQFGTYIAVDIRRQYWPPAASQAMIRLAAVIIAVALLVAPAEARRRKRVKRPVYRKPPVVYVLPDVVEPVSYAEYWQIEEQRRREAAIWRAIAVLFSSRLF